MHELSIAMSLVEVAAEQLEREGGGRVQTVYLKLGPLSGVVKEALLGAYELACEGSPLVGSKLVIQDVPVEIDCPVCRVRRPVESISEMRCAVCGTPSARIVSGRELELVAMEVAGDEPAPGK